MIKRILAISTIVMLLLLTIITSILGIIGSKYFLGMFYITIIVPVMMWGILILYRLIDKDK